jgi:hypothetical protein
LLDAGQRRMIAERYAKGETRGSAGWRVWGGRSHDLASPAIAQDLSTGASEQEKGSGQNPEGVLGDERNKNKDTNDRNYSDDESDDKHPVHWRNMPSSALTS